MEFSEVDWKKVQYERIIKEFQENLILIESEKEKILLAQRWEYVKTATRTVVFTFGEVEIKRKCFFKDGVYRYPVDEYLKLPPYTRFSMELFYELAELNTKVQSYRKTAEVYFDTKKIIVTHVTVMKAVHYTETLREEKEKYKYYKDEELLEKSRVDAEVIRMEGDGVQVKTRDTEGKRTEKDVKN